MSASDVIKGPRFEIGIEDDGYPASLRSISRPPERLYGIGDPDALRGGLAIVGARRMTPYGAECTERFTRIAAEQGIVIVSGGARGCDTVAHKTALEAGAPTVAVLGGGCDSVYPPQNIGLFQRMVDNGGAVVSEREWNEEPRPWHFRARNRIVAGLSLATLVVEAGIPSGTLSTTEEAREAHRLVMAVPGPITSAQSHGTNRLIYEGAVPVVSDEAFVQQLAMTFPLDRSPERDEAARMEVRRRGLGAIAAQAIEASGFQGTSKRCEEQRRYNEDRGA